ncbi:MAG: hypothetical protein WED33_10805 [Bacteroidia bacterium]
MGNFPEIDTITETIVDADALVDFARKVEERGYVIVHLTFPAQDDFFAIRVWSTTYLLSKTTNHQSRLVHAENVSMAPNWTEVPSNQSFNCTLYFEALPKDVILFDLAEVIPQPGGFLYRNIARNKSDVYRIKD